MSKKNVADNTTFENQRSMISSGEDDYFDEVQSNKKEALADDEDSDDDHDW